MPNFVIAGHSAAAVVKTGVNEIFVSFFKQVE